MVNKVYEFQSGDLVTALFYDRQKKEFSWRLGLALKREKVHRRDPDAQKRWKIRWCRDIMYSIVDFRIMCEFFRITSTDVIEDIKSYHDANRSLINSTVTASSGANGPRQISNPMLDSALTPGLRMYMHDVVSGLTDPCSNAQIEIDKILESHFTDIDTGV